MGFLVVTFYKLIHHKAKREEILLTNCSKNCPFSLGQVQAISLEELNLLQVFVKKVWICFLIYITFLLMTASEISGEMKWVFDLVCNRSWYYFAPPKCIKFMKWHKTEPWLSIFPFSYRWHSHMQKSQIFTPLRNCMFTYICNEWRH